MARTVAVDFKNQPKARFGITMEETDKLCLTSQLEMRLLLVSLLGMVMDLNSGVSRTMAETSAIGKNINLTSKLNLVELIR